ncbi:MAG: hypothetical protein BGO45_02120 [Microbacterium sp. 71-36]|uniref:universal stress protein n=1 Tax=unclassified Microbacterium TaxID=2609290 RepID=UPI00086D40A6|nr:MULTISPECIES: universal stress protein [unclassified Microbacterium]MBN9210327.1 universal stress protein [Microbacterium sp.]ODT42315.1 MAG: hypothetical protein ABS60_01095 [Microbacterium sp. SCN 71-17]ODU50587.1 MAG: hypothetical protein ABT07_03250 [Microbacterium sp. SCN 70-10]OJV74538.1 MAG: hypothetical protein BGO45_02120 [Microbacterium sp. 71-36]
MEKIVVGVDDSDAARSALEWVADRCARHAADVEVVHVVASADAHTTPQRDPLGNAERVLRAAAPGQDATYHRAKGGVADTLREVSAHADLLVIGVDPEHPVRAAVGGWLPVRVIARTEPPVCVVPAGWVPRPGTITVGLEDDVSSAEAVTFAAREAETTCGRLRIVHAWRLPEPSIDGAAALLVQPERILVEHRELLDATVRSVRRRFPALHIEADLVRSDPAAALLQQAPHSAMIVVGTHREGVVSGAFVGSVDRDLLWHAGCPIAVVPASSFPAKGA